MKKIYTLFLTLLLTLTAAQTLTAQERRPIDSKHPLWFIHCDVWYRADPQKIIDLIPEDIRPYVCLNLSLSCQFDAWVDDEDHSKGPGTQQYKMPDYAFQTYKTWGTVCQKNRIWFSCQPASGGHTHIQDYDMVTFEYFFKNFPNFLGWNYAEQFWGFDEQGDKSSATQKDRWALFGRLVEMSHKYGGLLTVSFCGNIWSHPLNPIGELKINSNFRQACEKYPEAILFLYKYTTSSCFYNNESVSFGPFISGLTKNYGVRYDNCGWNGALTSILGKNHGKKYPAAAGIGTVMEQTCVNGGAVWDGPELTWSEECFHEVGKTTVDGYQRRNWERFPILDGVWIDMFRQMLNGRMYIPTREEVVGKTKVVIINDVTSGSDENKYATWGDLYDGLYKQTDPFNRGNGQWMDNFCYFKSTGRYGTIPMVTGLYDDAAKAIPVQKKKSAKWSSISAKQNDFNRQYPVVSTGDMYVNRYRNQLVTYYPYTYLNKKRTCEAVIPLQYNTAKEMQLKYSLLSSAVIREFSDSIVFYMNNYRTDTTTFCTDSIILRGLTADPTIRVSKHKSGQNYANVTVTKKYEAATGMARIAVSHCGGVDLAIKCKGAEDRSAATDAIPITKLELPKQPEPWRGEILLEAEDMDYKSASVITDPFGANWGAYRSYVGYAGNGFVDMGSSTSGSLRYKLNLTKEQAGEYILGVRYMCSEITTTRTTFRATVNGTNKTMYLNKTADKEWRFSSQVAQKEYADLVVTLKEGENTIILTNINGKKMFIDQISLRPKDVAPMTYDITVNDANGGTITPDKTEAHEGDTIHLTITPNDGWKLKELKVINSVFYVRDMRIPVEYDENGKVTFVMPHDNMSIQPVFTDNSLLYKLDFTDVLNGGFPEGWRAIDGTTVHQYPESYGSGGGARTMVGFNGYQGKALYWRNTSADYGRQTAYPLTLEPGDYKLVWAMAAWKGTPQYKVQILKASNSAAIKTSGTFSATPNVNGNTSASVTSAVSRAMEFTVTEQGNYVINFAANSNAEYLLLDCIIKSTTTTGISTVTNAAMMLEGIYSPSGVRLQELQRGLNIVVDENGKSRKVFIK